jgi:hypothetical protein
VFFHVISDYKENPRPTFFVNSLENSTISILCVKNLRKIVLFEICFFINFYATIAPFLIRTRVKYPETLKGNNFKIPRSNFFKFGTVL